MYRDLFLLWDNDRVYHPLGDLDKDSETFRDHPFDSFVIDNIKYDSSIDIIGLSFYLIT